MTPTTVYREIVTAGLLLASYPLDLFARQGERLLPTMGGDLVILAHGLGGSRANFLAFAAYVRFAGFPDIAFFEYPRFQSVSESAQQLGEFVNKRAPKGGVHLIGHSLGGTIARRYASTAPRDTVRSLITIGSPYSLSQISSDEVAIFGDEDPIVPPPPAELVDERMFKRMMVLDNAGHLAILYHPETLRIVATEMRVNRE